MLASRLSAPPWGHRTDDPGNLGPCLEGQVLSSLRSRAVSETHWLSSSEPVEPGTRHTPAGSDQSQLPLAGAGLDPGIWGKGQLVLEGEWGWGKVPALPRPALPWLSLSCSSSGPWAWTAPQEALGTGCKGNPATASLCLPPPVWLPLPRPQPYQPGSCSLRSRSRALGPGFAPMSRRGPPNAHGTCHGWIPCVDLKTILHQNKIVFRFHFPRLSGGPSRVPATLASLWAPSAHALSGSPERGTSSSL